MPFYDVDGAEIHPDFVPFPALCRGCRKNLDLDKYIFCSMRRIQRRFDDVFVCTGFQPISPEFNREKLS